MFEESFWNVQIGPLELNKETLRKQAQLRDKYMRVRVRYKGDVLTIINAIKTQFIRSYS